MINTLRSEIKRSFCNKLFLLSIIISGVLVLWFAIERIPVCIEMNQELLNGNTQDNFLEVSYNNWLGSHNIYLQQEILYLILPFLAVLPFGGSFYADMNHGYVKNVCIRTKKSHYLISKYIAVFISGGSAVVLPLIFSFVITSAFLPTMLPEASYAYTNIDSTCKWADLFFVHPMLYDILYMVLTFVVSGLIACLSLFITYFSSKSFLVLIFPFFVYICSSLFFELLSMDKFSLRNILVTDSSYGNTFSVVVLIVALFIISFVPYYVIGVKKDVL